MYSGCRSPVVGSTSTAPVATRECYRDCRGPAFAIGGLTPDRRTAAGRPAFVLPGPSGANNGMHLPLRIALWRDLADFLEVR